MSFLAMLAVKLGISSFRLYIYAALFAAVLAAGVAIRQHYVNLGWDKAITAVKKQDDRAVAAASKVQQKANECEAQSYWDVISKSCKTGDE